MKAFSYFREPSFFKGMGRVFDLFGTMDEYKYSEDPDSDLLKKDWEIVGKDLKREITNHERQSCCQ